MKRGEWRRMQRWLVRFLVLETVLVGIIIWCCAYLAAYEPPEPEIITVVRYVSAERGAADVQAEQEPSEDPDEPEKIEAALLRQGYYRDDVPLSHELQDTLHTVCEQEGVEYALALGLIEVESGFLGDAVNPKSGCYGLCQLNPAYFPADLTPEENIKAGIAYLAEQLQRYDGDIEAALCAYNAGYDTEERTYATKVLAAADAYKEGE